MAAAVYTQRLVLSPVERKSQTPRTKVTNKFHIQAFKSQTKKGVVVGHWSLEFACYLGFAIWNLCASNIDNTLSI
jgi:hypothetical protein